MQKYKNNSFWYKITVHLTSTLHILSVYAYGLSYECSSDRLHIRNSIRCVIANKIWLHSVLFRFRAADRRLP